MQVPSAATKASGTIRQLGTVQSFRFHVTLFEFLGFKIRESAFLQFVANLDGIAANFTIFNIDLTGNRQF
jgi:hypothetical protein